MAAVSILQDAGANARSMLMTVNEDV